MASERRDDARPEPRPPHLHEDAHTPFTTPPGQTGDANAIVDCGWGRLIFAHTFETNEALAEALQDERPDRRDIAFYVPEPHVLLSLAPQELFLDPSHTFRLDFADYTPAERRPDAHSRKSSTEQ